MHAIDDVAREAGQSIVTASRHVLGLAAGGLAVTFTLGRKRFAGITQPGLEHPSREGMSRAGAARDLPSSIGVARIAFIQVLAVLGEAATVDVTAALARKAGDDGKTLSGQMMARLVANGFVERVPGSVGRFPPYRLTQAGHLAASLAGASRRPPYRSEIEERTQAFHAARPGQAARAPSQEKEAADGAARRKVLEALSGGPLSTTALRAAAADHLRNTGSIYNALKWLERRGAVRSAGWEGKVELWQLAPGGGPEIAD